MAESEGEQTKFLQDDRRRKGKKKRFGDTVPIVRRKATQNQTIRGQELQVGPRLSPTLSVPKLNPVATRRELTSEGGAGQEGTGTELTGLASRAGRRAGYYIRT